MVDVRETALRRVLGSALAHQQGDKNGKENRTNIQDKYLSSKMAPSTNIYRSRKHKELS